MTPTKFPVRYVIFDGPKRGKIVGTDYLRFGDAAVYDEVERRAARIAREWEAEIDIEFGAVMPSGKVASYERIGMRVLPV